MRVISSKRCVKNVVDTLAQIYLDVDTLAEMYLDVDTFAGTATFVEKSLFRINARIDGTDQHNHLTSISQRYIDPASRKDRINTERISFRSRKSVRIQIHFISL